MKELSHVNKLINELKAEGFYTLAEKVEKRSQDLFLAKALAIKRAQKGLEEAEDKSGGPTPSNMLQDLLGALRANLNCSQVAHWVSKGKNYYGDHLLYERIYNENNEEIDAFVEKFIPQFGEAFVQPAEVLEKAFKLSQKFHSASTENADPNDLAEGLLMSEKYLLEQIVDLYHQLKEKEVLSLGADDLLMGMHNTHENHVYLLMQRTK